MTFSEFKYLVTNVTAIVNQAFTIQCGEFATAVAREQDSTLSPVSFDTEKHLETFDFQAVLDSGYSDLDELDAQFRAAWDQVPHEDLEELINQTPAHLPSLTKKLEAGELSDWVRHSLNASEDTPLYRLHQAITTLFETGDDEISDIIREAIAYDKTDELEAGANSLSAEQINLDDLITAATIESFNALGWLLNRAELNDDDIISLLESNIDDSSVSARVVELLSLTPEQKTRIVNMAQSQNNHAIADLLG